MNLIEDAWIPVRTNDGLVERVAPWQISASKGKKYLELAAPRPDFNGALIQFLIGLLQTTCAPKKPREWRDWLKTPPKTSDLKKRFSTISDAFELDADGPRFMQDISLEGKSYSPIGSLLMDTPGENTIKQNADHFVKRGRIDRLCPSCAATALLTIQINAPTGGAGHLTGIRGGGPLTTLVISDTLWDNCWLNVLNSQDFFSLANPTKKAEQFRFPWLATSSNEYQGLIAPDDVHPDQLFWATPRRILLNIEARKDKCDLCGIPHSHLSRQYLTKPRGINYGESGIWRHPLSAYFVSSSQQASAIHPQVGGFSYSNWLGLVQASSDKSGHRKPAQVVENFIAKSMQQKPFRLWSFGYAMDKMKACCWYDSTMPLILAGSSVREKYDSSVANMVYGARLIAWQTTNSIKKAMFDRPGDVKGDLSFIRSRFYQETEGSFFEHLYKIRTLIESRNDIQPALRAWHKQLASKAEEVFDDLSQSGVLEAAEPKRISLALRDLRKYIWGKKVREQLGLLP